MTRSAQSAMATIGDFINAVGMTKAADSPLSEPGSVGGPTSHPVKSVDDRLEKAKEGERSAENSKDVKEDQGPPSIENAGEAKAASVFDVANRLAKGRSKKADGTVVSQGGSAADDHLQLGTNVQATGDDPSNETGSVKATKDDKKEGGLGGTSHPASTENSALDGHKYAFDATTPLVKLAEMAAEAGNQVCAELALIGHDQGLPALAKTAAAQSNGRVATPPKRSAVSPELAKQAGWELASLLSGDMDKQAADRMVHTALTGTIKEASDDADRFLQYAAAWANDRRKTAGEEPPPPPEEGGGGMPPPGGGGGGEDPSAMLAALGGGGGGPPGAGGPPPGGEMPPGAGGPPGGEMPPGEGGGGEDPVGIVLAIMEQLGVTPEELQGAAPPGGAPGGEPPMPGGPPGGGMPPPPGAGGGGMPPMEVQASAKAAANKQASTREVLAEILNRGRRK